MSNFPEYRVRKSPRAKHVRFKMSARDGLVVVIPKGFDQKRIPELIERKKQWLQKATTKAEEQRKFFVPPPPGDIPERITLRAIGQEWTLDYRLTETSWVAAVQRQGNRLLVYGDTDDVTKCKEALRRWLSRKTHKFLVPWLQQLAQEHKFPLNRVLVKSQRTRWASCSRHKTLSINQKLLFIPGHLIRYVFLHELCHTIYLNHSREFWALVQEKEPKYKQFDEELRRAWQYLPAWIMPIESCSDDFLS
jgi:predicted metal-dependent hydrolase